jgi:hypothetical protein
MFRPSEDIVKVMSAQRGFVETIIAVLVLAIGLVGLYFYYQNTPHVKPNAPAVETSEPTPQASPEIPATNSGVICTQEAKLCSDGSYVGRSGPNCEFTACPAIKTSP